MKYAYEAESLLKKLISIKSFSFYEDKTADYIENILLKLIIFSAANFSRSVSLPKEIPEDRFLTLLMNKLISSVFIMPNESPKIIVR